MYDVWVLDLMSGGKAVTFYEAKQFSFLLSNRNLGYVMYSMSKVYLSINALFPSKHQCENSFRSVAIEVKKKKNRYICFSFLPLKSKVCCCMDRYIFLQRLQSVCVRVYVGPLAQCLWLIKGKVHLFTVNVFLGSWQGTASAPKSTNILLKMLIYVSAHEVNISLFTLPLKYMQRGGLGVFSQSFRLQRWWFLKDEIIFLRWFLSSVSHAWSILIIK